ncbi:MAG: TetR family transcriptional regulator [Verrucomicrobiota bacterium]|jgi:AcrR family transcriptional regulator|nr:TetR family transcriptional regulator [Verrucomicrobiota bacterium]
MPKADTKTKILDAAEKLFAQKGFDAVSLRNIVETAKVNLAAVHYHFGSKQALLHKVVSRRFRPINKERLNMLAQAKSKAGNHKLKLEAVLESLFLPIFRAQANPKAGRSFTRLIGRVVFDRNTELQKFMLSELTEVFIQFSKAFEEALPDLERTEMDWRSHFMAGAMAHTLCNADLLASFTKTNADDSELETTIQRLIDFTAGGFRAKVSNTLKT